METQAAAAKNPDTLAERVETVARELFDIQVADLKRIADIGMQIIEGLGRMAHEAEAAPDVPRRNSAAPGADAVVLSFARASRAVRLTFALQNDLVDRMRRAGDAAALSARVAEAFAPPAPPAPPSPERVRKDEIAKALTDILREDAAGETERGDRLIREASECLKDRESFADILARPMSEIVAHVCAELGVEPDWGRLSTAAWAREEVASGKVGAPLKPPSPWMGTAKRGEANGLGMGVAPSPANPEAVEPPPPPIPALSPIQGERNLI